MDVKQFLSQAYNIDKRIIEKTELVEILRESSASANSTLSPIPIIKSRNFQHMEQKIVKLLDLENEIKNEIVELMNVKLEIVYAICCVETPKYRRLLEQRYLNFKKWDQIAKEMGYDLRYLHKLHRSALLACNSVLNKNRTPKDTKRHLVD